jgi:hypothetical protein
LTLYPRGLAPKTSDASLTGTGTAIRPRHDKGGVNRLMNGRGYARFESLGGNGNNRQRSNLLADRLSLLSSSTAGYIRRYSTVLRSNLFSVLMEKFTKAPE